jgi:gas vesicle protein
MMSFLAGLGLGFGLGMLYAPMRGQDMRELLASRANEAVDAARSQYEQVRDKAESAIGALRGEIEERSGKTG